jgi:hypothetical protein
MNLVKGMTISVTTVAVATPTAADRPTYLPDYAEWPVADGQRIMYNYGSTEHCVCSDCVKDDDIVEYTAEYYGHRASSLRQVATYDNYYWTCSARRRDDGCRACGGKNGTRL